jgi:hypothetical protein
MADASHSWAITQALVHYLRASPQASDTAEGIRLWWLDPALEVTMEQLQTALDELRSCGLIEESHAADGRRRYRRIGTDAQFDAWLARGASPTRHNGDATPPSQG